MVDYEQLSAQVCDFYTDHLLSEISNKFKISNTSIYKILKNAGIDWTSHKKDILTKRHHELLDILSKKLDDIVTFYKTNNLKDTADNFEISIKTLLELFELNNVNVKTASETIKAKFDVNPTQTKAVRDKRRQTCLEKYGVTSNLLIPEIKAKAIKNSYTSDVYEKTKQTKFQKYGSFSEKQKDFSDEFKELYHNKELSVQFLSSFDDKPTRQQLAERFTCPISSIIFWINNFNLAPYIKQSASRFEDEILDFIGRDVCIRNTRKVLPSGKELDIYIPSLKLGIEFNGTYFHSSLNSTDKNYHYNKSLEAEEAGIRLIHIYEYEWEEKQEQIKSLLTIALGRSEKIYARKCIIKEISNIEARDFNNANHLQGHRNAQVTYGLFYEDKLVQLMSFSKTRYNRNITDDTTWEIIRGCPGSNNIVVGGVSKLLKHFIKEHNPSKIFSYCDFNKFDGKSYLACGMKFIGYTGPDKKWVLDDRTVINRNPHKYKELKEKAIGTIWGSGSKKYILELNQ